ncbi:MAG: ATP-binding protein, partial [Rubrivivax sp.]
RVFDAFQRGAAATDAPPQRGAGVGLALCRLIARAHGGELVLIDREGGGCSAECALPAESAQAPAMEAAP